MRFIEEIVVDEFLPTVRSMLAERLRERGHTQREIADTLGISQSAVSKYVHDEVTTNEAIRTDEQVKDVVDTITEGLASGDMTRVQALIELEVLIRELEAGGLLASLHEQAMPKLADFDGQRIHDPSSELRARQQTLASLRRGLRMLETTSGFANLIPNVGSNLVAALPDASVVADVAGVPGRIFDIKGQTTIPADPEFGVSEHVATVLLAARETGSNELQAAVNIAYQDDLIAQLESMGHTTAAFDPDQELAVAVKNTVSETPDATVIYQTGGVGVEPIIYLLGTDVDGVVETVRTLT